MLRGYAETMYRAKSWSKPRRACARIEATSLGLDIRYVVTSLAAGSAEHIYAYLCQISRNAGQAKIAFSVQLREASPAACGSSARTVPQRGSANSMAWPDQAHSKPNGALTGSISPFVPRIGTCPRK